VGKAKAVKKAVTANVAARAEGEKAEARVVTGTKAVMQVEAEAGPKAEPREALKAGMQVAFLGVGKAGQEVVEREMARWVVTARAVPRVEVLLAGEAKAGEAKVEAVMAVEERAATEWAARRVGQRAA
jgi:hypothetical protein